MAAQVLSFFQRSPRYAPAPADWSQQELAEFYRVESALIRAGVRVGTDRGLSDENEPWFVFYRSDDGEVVIHFARIDGEYMIAGPAYEEIARGFDFTALVRNLVARHPLIRKTDNGSNLSIHPAALLVAVVGTAFFKTGEARAAESGATNAQSGHHRPVLLSSSSNASLTNGVAPIAFQQPTYDSVQIPANQAILILAAAMFASDHGAAAPPMDPVASAGITAAAAALDFGGAVALAPQSDGSLPSDGHAHLATIDNSPAQTVPSVLSLIALLSSMPDSISNDTAPTRGDDVVKISTTDRYEAPQMASASEDTANWALNVRINWGAGQTVEAVQLVRGVVGDASYQKITVIEVTKLPDVLADLIAKGDHYLTPTPGQHSSDLGLVDPVTPSGPVTPPSVGDNTPDSGAPNPPPQDHTPPASGGPTTTPYHGFAPEELVRQFIEYFVDHTKDVGIMTVGMQVVMYDTRTVHDAGAIDNPTSMTFTFFDGSSVSLVGDHSSFLHDGILF
jgi:hypothetical protein